MTTSKAHIQKQRGSIRHARIAGIAEPVVYGEHDHIVAAVGGCLNGTLTGALEVRQIPATPERAVNSHPKKCPAAVSIQGAIALEVTAEITEE